MNKVKTFTPKTIEEAVNELQTFLEADMWHSFEDEFTGEEDMCNYLYNHFKILREQIRKIKKKESKHGQNFSNIFNVKGGIDKYGKKR